MSTEESNVHSKKNNRNITSLTSKTLSARVLHLELNKFKEQEERQKTRMENLARKDRIAEQEKEIANTSSNCGSGQQLTI